MRTLAIDPLAPGASLALVLAALLTGCTTLQVQPFQVQVDGIFSGTDTDKRTYILLPGNKDTAPEDLQFQEYATYVHRALQAQGYSQAAGLNQADIALFLVYGIGDPQLHQYTYSLPVWGQTGISSSSTYGTVSSFGGYSTYAGTTTYTPSYGITGYTTHTGTVVTYFRFLLLDAYDVAAFKRDNKLVPVWRTTVTSIGSSGDLRRVLPVLIAASRPYLGSNTGQQVRIVLYEDSQAVLEVKGLLSKKP